MAALRQSIKHTDRHRVQPLPPRFSGVKGFWQAPASSGELQLPSADEDLAQHLTFFVKYE
jgi:hypothetical protein